MSAVIVSAKRTPIGSYLGSLSSIKATDLGAIAIEACVKSAGLKTDEIHEVIMGCVLSGGLGQAPARQAMIKAGLSEQTHALTINKVCGSGLKAVMLANNSIVAKESDVVVAGGMENMSQAPYFLEKARSGYRMGDGQLKDMMIHDGLWDPYNQIHMGSIAEKCATEHQISREEQDAYAKISYERAVKAQTENRFADEIVPVNIPQRKKEDLVIAEDEEPKKGDTSKLTKLRAVFAKEGTVTAGNASSLNDGASAVLVMDEEVAKAKGCQALVRIVAQATASQDPIWFTTAPKVAIQKVLQKANLKVSDIDLWEVNEAFAVVSVYHNQELKIPPEKCNVNGGAIALGHPIGASGNRILVTLIHEMQKQKNCRYGLVSLCNGGGEAVAMIVEKIEN